MRDAFRDAKNNPADEVTFRWLRLNQWVGSTVAWIPDAVFMQGDKSIDYESLKGRECYAGLDLSTSEDITALVLIFPPRTDDEKYILLPFFWIPEENIAKKVRKTGVPYDVWRAKGLLIRMLHGGGKNGYDQYPFSDKLICPYCKKRLTQRNIHGGAWGQGQGWGCACGKFLLKSQSIEEAVLDAFLSLDMESIEGRLPKLKPARRAAAEKLIELKKKENVDAVHYFWVEPLIDSIEFGECGVKEDCLLMVRWKFGMTSTRPLKTRKTPRQYAELDKRKGRGKK